MLSQICSYSTERISVADFPAVDYITTDNILQNFGGVKAYDGEANFSSAVRYQKQDILISNIRPYLKKIWIADKDGGCSPDVLVLKLVSDSYIPDFIYFALARQQFFDFVIMDVKGMKMPRGKKSILCNMNFLLCLSQNRKI